MVSAQGINTTVTFGAGPDAVSRMNVTFVISNDLVALEDLEMYSVSLLPPPEVVLGDINQTTVTILDDDGVLS